MVVSVFSGGAGFELVDFEGGLKGLGTFMPLWGMSKPCNLTFFPSKI